VNTQWRQLSDVEEENWPQRNQRNQRETNRYYHLKKKTELCFEHFFRMLISIRKEKDLQKAQ